MKKLVKPKASIESLSDEVVQAFCELGNNCSSKCVVDEDGWCLRVKDVELDDDILI